MDPSAPPSLASSERFPRTRGDGPGMQSTITQRAAVSPHTRGWTRWAPCSGAMTAGFPRTRGDGPRSATAALWRSRVSPHTRGWTLKRLLDVVGEEGFPAHAGMDPCSERLAAHRLRFPRTRGDGPWIKKGGRELAVVSPHTRGWTRADTADCMGLFGFPAHAGMDPGLRVALPCEAGFPRTRGDGPRRPRACARRFGVSPHTRGWTRTDPNRRTRS